MNKYVKQAKNEGLNWQTILIEEAETDLKVIIKQAILKDLSFAQVNAQVTRAVNKYIADIEIAELKERAKKILYDYATREYWRTKDAVRNFNLSLFDLILLTATNKRVKGAQAREIRRAVARSPSINIRGITADNAVTATDTGYYEIGQALQTYSKTYMSLVEKAFNELATSTARDGYASNVSLRNIAEMTVRYDKHVKDLSLLKANGVRLAWTSTHANCSKRCEPWQGKLYSLDGTSGTIDGIRYRPLEDATDIYYTTKAGKTYKNGIISGFNCRHYLIPYEKGNKPVEVPAKVVERQREIDERQRELEREIRLAKDKALIYKGISDPAYKNYKQLAINKNKEYIAFSRANKVAFYPSRTKIFESESSMINARLKNKLDENNEIDYTRLNKYRATQFTEQGKKAY